MTTLSTDVPSPFNVFGKRAANEWEAAQTQKRRRGACGPAGPAAFGCSQGENAQKRSANVFAAADNGARGKRTRCEDENDIPRYTQRHLSFLEHQKNTEMEKVRQECQLFIQSKEAENHQLMAEKNGVCARMLAQQKEIDRILAENSILKKAVTIQQKKVEEGTAENAALKNGLYQAANHIKTMEQTNYALQVHLQQQQPNIGFGNSHRPPDVF